MTVSVLVPWRFAPERQVAWNFLRPRWEALGWQVVHGEAPDGPWCKAAAVADALRRADGDVLVVADADVWTDGITEAVAQVQAGAPWAVPHYRVLRLNKAATAQTLVSGDWPTVTRSWLDRPPYVGRRGGGIVVLSRDVYERVPLDHRFLGWGREDDAWALALRGCAGVEWRGLADLWHLWHPPQKQRGNGRGSAESEVLYRRYVDAKRDPQAMRALIDEARTVTV